MATPSNKVDRQSIAHQLPILSDGLVEAGRKLATLETLTEQVNDVHQVLVNDPNAPTTIALLGRLVDKTVDFVRSLGVRGGLFSKYNEISTLINGAKADGTKPAVAAKPTITNDEKGLLQGNRDTLFGALRPVVLDVNEKQKALVERISQFSNIDSEKVRALGNQINAQIGTITTEIATTFSPDRIEAATQSLKLMREEIGRVENIFPRANFIAQAKGYANTLETHLQGLDAQRQANATAAAQAADAAKTQANAVETERARLTAKYSKKYKNPETVRALVEANLKAQAEEKAAAAAEKTASKSSSSSSSSSSRSSDEVEESSSDAEESSSDAEESSSASREAGSSREVSNSTNSKSTSSDSSSSTSQSSRKEGEKAAEERSSSSSSSTSQNEGSSRKEEAFDFSKTDGLMTKLKTLVTPQVDVEVSKPTKTKDTAKPAAVDSSMFVSKTKAPKSKSAKASSSTPVSTPASSTSSAPVDYSSMFVAKTTKKNKKKKATKSGKSGSSKPSETPSVQDTLKAAKKAIGKVQKNKLNANRDSFSKNVKGALENVDKAAFKAAFKDDAETSFEKALKAAAKAKDNEELRNEFLANIISALAILKTKDLHK